MRDIDLGWMRIFVETARLGSLSEAAQKLNLTQPAVSYQIRKAEAEFGCALFRRQSRGVDLTDEGRQVFQVLSTAQTRIDELAGQFRKDPPNTRLRLFTDYAFSSLWLMPRLHQFQQSCPDPDLQIIASQNTDLGQLNKGDMAVVFRSGADLPASAHLLMPEIVVPVCAPNYRFASLDQAHLIHLDSPQVAPWLDWAGYLDTIGTARDLRSKRGNLRFNTYSLVIEAAKSGQGIALGWVGLVDDMLASRALVQAGPELRMPDRGYYLVTRAPLSSHGQNLREWLTRQIDQTAA